MPFHAANPATSDRLKRILQMLQDRGDGGATSWELMTECKTVAIGTCISELRHAGYNIECTQEKRDQDRKTTIFRYTLVLPRGQGTLFSMTTLILISFSWMLS